MARREIKSHKKASETNPNVVGDIHSLLNWDADGGLKAADDCAEPDEKVEKSSVAAVEATINYVNHLLNESDEELPEDPEDQVDDEDPSLDNVEDEEEDFGDDEDGEGDEDIEECGDKKRFFSEDDESMAEDEDEEDDDEDFGDEDGEDLDVDDGEDAEVEDEDEGLEENYFSEGDELEDMDDEEEPEDSEEEDLGGDEEDLGDEDEEDLDDISESYFFEGDEEGSFDDEGSDDESDGLSIDIPENIDPNDVSVSVGGSEYVPDTDDEGGDEDLGDLDDDALAGEDEEGEDEDTDEPVQEGYFPFAEEFFRLGEDDDPDVEDVEDEEPTYEDSELDDEEEDEDEDVGEEEPEEEVTESAVMRALRRLIREGERSDDPITADPSDSTGDAPIDSESDIDDSEAEEKDLSGDEGEVTDGDIPITPGTIQPEEAAELKWMARKLRAIMEGDDLDSHSDGDGKVDAEPLDGDAQDMIGDIGDELADDGELTDTGNGAVDDSETTLGSPDEADDDVEVEGEDVVSSNGDSYNTEADEEAKLTDNYHMLMTAIREAYAKKKGKKVKLKKVDKKKGKKKKKLSEGSLANTNFNAVGGDYSTSKYPELTDTPRYSKNYTSNNGKVNSTSTLENTVLGSFNAQEMTSVLRNLNNAFGTGKIAKEVRDSSVVSEVSVPKWSLPIAENATWDSVGAGKLLSETAYKSESKVNFDLMKKSHLYWENDGSKESDYKFPIASIVEGQAQIIPEAITEATKLFASPSFITRFSESSLKKIRNVLDFYNEKMGKKSPWKENKQINVTEAAKITMIDRTQYNPLMVLKRLSEQEKAKSLINLRG